MSQYSHEAIEKKWHHAWATKKLYQTKDSVSGMENKMVLVEFPYPSGNLHMGHWYAFALPDMYARYQRMQGYNVMYPMGFDAFGLPAENAAIKRDIHPEEWTRHNIAHMTEQMQSMGTMFDWSRVVSTIDPDYYRWTQWMFLRMFEKDLAYRAKTTVNWCPNDKTVLANEQVVDGCCERCGTAVQQRELEQWMMRITKYADRLIDDIEGLDWPRTTQLAQKNWIGRSQGARITWKLNMVPGQADGKHTVETFTTRPDTIYGVTFLVVSPELAKRWLDVGWDASTAVKEYIGTALGKRDLERMEEKEKTGVPTDIEAVHPFTGETIPVWVADYVLGSYGTGAIMAVPAHDERDFEFSEKFGLTRVCVINPIPAVVAQVGDSLEDADEKTKARIAAIQNGEIVYSQGGSLMNSGEFNDMSFTDAQRVIIEKLKKKGVGDVQTTYKLRDWVLSRQRYWGVPIPVTHCPVCGYVPVPDKDLPVKLPPLKDFKPADDGRSPLAKATDWLHVKCPTCDGPAERETDTMDTFVDSSWYYLRYADPDNAKAFASPKALKAWMPVSIYIGGAEHNTMHLLYSRFFAKVLNDLGYIDFSEPFTARRNHGIILGPDGQKMSKSKGNVVDPDKEVAQYGADVVRMYLAFMAPYEQGGPWDPKGINGVDRFLKRVWNLYSQSMIEDSEVSGDIERALHLATKKIGEDLNSLAFNTCVSELMKLLNVIEGANSLLTADQRERFLLLLAPLAPHITEELWHSVLEKKTSIHLESWPEYDLALLVSDIIELPVQVNGKLRGSVVVAPDAKQDDVVFLARAVEGVARYVEGQEVRKIIYVPGKMLNIVVQ